MEVYKDGGFARCSQTDRQTGTDRQGEEGESSWRELKEECERERREEEEGETVGFVMSE